MASSSRRRPARPPTRSRRPDRSCCPPWTPSSSRRSAPIPSPSAPSSSPRPRSCPSSPSPPGPKRSWCRSTARWAPRSSPASGSSPSALPGRCCSSGWAPKASSHACARSCSGATSPTASVRSAPGAARPRSRRHRRRDAPSQSRIERPHRRDRSREVHGGGRPGAAPGRAQLGALLVDLHGQHETQSLLRPEVQRDLLDAYGGAQLERGAVRTAHERWKALAEREEELRAKQEEVLRKADYLRHVAEEIATAAPRVGEDEALTLQSRRLAHAEELGRLVRDLEQAVDTAGLARAAKMIAALQRLDPEGTGQWQELLDAAFANVEELARAARDYAVRIETDPGALAAIEQRRDALSRLMRKYGPTLPDVLAARDAALAELELLDTADLDLRNLAAERDQALEDFRRACAALTAHRTAGAARLADAVSDLLPALGMPGGRFVARLQPRTTQHAYGAEDVLFEVQLNVGMEARPLARVASGGELSRLMLALKVVLARHDAVPTLVFDEVDQGIGGEAGARGGVATSDVQVVAGEARRRELARMLGDRDMATALRHAEELLKRAVARPAAPAGTP